MKVPVPKKTGKEGVWGREKKEIGTAAERQKEKGGEGVNRRRGNRLAHNTSQSGTRLIISI